MPLVAAYIPLVSPKGRLVTVLWNQNTQTNL